MRSTGGAFELAFRVISSGFWSLPGRFPYRKPSVWLVSRVFPHPRPTSSHETSTWEANRAGLTGSAGGAPPTRNPDEFRVRIPPKSEASSENTGFPGASRIFPHPRQPPSHETNTLAAFRQDSEWFADSDFAEFGQIPAPEPSGFLENEENHTVQIFVSF